VATLAAVTEACLQVQQQPVLMLLQMWQQQPQQQAAGTILQSQLKPLHSAAVLLAEMGWRVCRSELQ
jgi:hypothetical protein